MIVEKPQILTDKRLVGLVCKPGRPEADQAANRIAEFMGSHDISVLVDPGSCGVSSERVDPTPIEEMDVDFVVTVGGDGTILYTLSKMKDRETPLFCVNRGSVGFLTETSTTTAITALEKVIRNECVIEQNVNIASGVGERRFEEALNEVYVVSRMPGRLLTFQVHLDGVRIDYGRADGAMVSTPSGSTAYSLAAGGSILSPDVNGFIFVPVCPPRFELKSVVIPDNCVIELELVKPGAQGLAVIDGQATWDIEPSEKVWVKKADCVTRFIRLYDNYWDRVNTRLVPRTL
ncbi:MAG: NAD(+)/NADH kinase [Candidatus Thorarchaeota archaeon]|nr:MAG: NAD(+)/NADH kinase [Candidatus Thorarchaeota archaeon]